MKNRAIEDRNSARERAALELERPSRVVASKLASARRNGERKVIAEEDIVFSTDKAAGQQANANEMEEWDRRLERASDAGAKGVGSNGSRRPLDSPRW